MVKYVLKTKKEKEAKLKWPPYPVFDFYKFLKKAQFKFVFKL